MPFHLLRVPNYHLPFPWPEADAKCRLQLGKIWLYNQHYQCLLDALCECFIHDANRCSSDCGNHELCVGCICRVCHDFWHLVRSLGTNPLQRTQGHPRRYGLQRRRFQAYLGDAQVRALRYGETPSSSRSEGSDYDGRHFPAGEDSYT